MDRAALATYCQTWARYVEAEAMIAQYGGVLKAKQSDYIQVSPYVTISRQCSATIKAFAAEFGLTPGSRSRMTYEMPAPPQRTFAPEAETDTAGDPRARLRAVK